MQAQCRRRQEALRSVSTPASSPTSATRPARRPCWRAGCGRWRTRWGVMPRASRRSQPARSARRSCAAEVRLPPPPLASIAAPLPPRASHSAAHSPPLVGRQGAGLLGLPAALRGAGAAVPGPRIRRVCAAGAHGGDDRGALLHSSVMKCVSVLYQSRCPFLTTLRCCSRKLRLLLCGSL